MRLFECQGIATEVTVDIPVAAISLEIGFEPFEIRTFMLRGGELLPCDMLEGAVPLELDE